MDTTIPHQQTTHIVDEYSPIAEEDNTVFELAPIKQVLYNKDLIRYVISFL